mmetsp:Transcript_14529/g.29801  ORF Transcript_14529/g.29801 Transcript_14529/m.29801 type:complete len:203 (+) Transcript_14529:326-934(+)
MLAPNGVSGDAGDNGDCTHPSVCHGPSWQESTPATHEENSVLVWSTHSFGSAPAHPEAGRVSRTPLTSTHPPKSNATHAINPSSSSSSLSSPLLSPLLSSFLALALPATTEVPLFASTAASSLFSSEAVSSYFVSGLRGADAGSTKGACSVCSRGVAVPLLLEERSVPESQGLPPGSSKLAAPYVSEPSPNDEDARTAATLR